MEKSQNIKIAAITENGKTISQHFGRAPYYLVITIENDRIVQRELREKPGHAQFRHQEHTETPGQPHGFDAASHNRHVSMAQAIADCAVLLCGGMGMGAYESMKAMGIQPIVTDIADIDQAVTAYLEGNIVDHTERLH